MSTAEPTDAGQQRGQDTHFWVLSVDKPGMACATRTGTYTPPPGSTRASAYREIYEYVTAGDPYLRGATVVFFSLEPNQL
ncbi:hypothetical protein [Streptomyces sp. NPDC088794]|uniref:hypothetical protein n=1 Tax=Streptomyces sp. NPDC088794 TaxID=3365902 RepID=UPI00381230AD